MLKQISQENIVFLSLVYARGSGQHGHKLQWKVSITRTLSGSYPVGQIFLFNGMPFLHKSAVTINRISSSDLESFQCKGDSQMAIEGSRKIMS